jgi:hypothetical protein
MSFALLLLSQFPSFTVMIFHAIKSFSLFIIMFFSLRYLGVPVGAALIASLIPLVLGVTGVLTNEAFGLAGIVFFVAALSALFPPQIRNMIGDIGSATTSLGIEATTAKTAESANSKPASKAAATSAAQKP